MTFWRMLNREGRVGAVVLAALLLMALLAPWIAPGDPLAITGEPMLRPFASAAHILGTDRLGRDVLGGLLHGTRTTLLVACFSAAVALVVGSIVGTLAGYLGGLADTVLMRITDAFQTVPAFLLALAAISVTGPSVPTLIFAISLGTWTQAARVTRAEVLSLRERDFVAAARALGMRPLEIAFREVLPNAFGPAASLAAISVAAAILIEAALSFLGFGDPNRVTWGSMIAEGRTVLRAAPYLSIVPGIALVVTVLGAHLLGRGLSRTERLQP
ncbi:ABC transporter permease [Phyllobacterium bourgognense]|uniref:Peptide/nickel transport system permease protein n=1 Tax=Phyllobacterium bourgognense TaxID=314236 RepID=A0A368YKB2_9HYPH|nr:ABC transporter permease [Phyllobacterium bourgognense]RCW79347.1 peptide/nickel transport system permease protein [Phyllobacterium bourgognense]